MDLLKLGNNPELQRIIEAIERSLVQEARLIDDLLDMARITSGKLAIRKQPMHLSHCLRAAVDTLQPKARAREQVIWLSLGSPFPMLQADPVRLQQVICNLLDNAVKFSPEGGRITIEARHSNGRAVVKVTDAGPGIDPSFLPRIFEPFHQADSSTRRQHGGLGLGLAIARQLIELHDGKLQVENLEPGPGACFTFHFPIVEAAPPAPAPASVAPQGLRLLLVDDSPDTVQMLSCLLQAKGLLVQTASCVRQALEKAQAEPFDVIVTDIGMPGQDGYDLLGLLRADERLRNVPVVAATGYIGSKELTYMANLGFAAILSKPFELDELLRTLNQVRQL